ncbi:MAG: endonuclease/exonuclease/phosphatase family protein [Bdellovibrionales bacterium]|nr:endonuclease/exonuclease/phosphatase family protein [Bdellovibrionales bacterium]
MIFFNPPDTSDEIIEFGRFDKNKKKLKVLVWNVYKGKRKEFKTEFLRHFSDCDLYILQEIVTTDELIETLSFDPNICWVLGSSFEYKHNKIKTGVAIGSRIPIENPKLIRGSESELLIWTPKVSLMVENKDLNLLIVSTHFVNFTTTNRFKFFLEELLEKIAHFQGKIILAGDFNTWNFKRWHQLTTGLKKSGLNHYKFQQDHRILRLDHLFFKDIQIASAQVLSGLNGSDHLPLVFEVEI